MDLVRSSISDGGFGISGRILLFDVDPKGRRPVAQGEPELLPERGKAVDQRFSGAVTTDVFAKNIANVVKTPTDLPRDVRRYEDVVETPKRVFRRERFRRSNVHHRAAEPSGSERVDEGVRLDYRAASEVREESARLHFGEFFGVNNPASVGVERKGEENDVRFGEEIVQTVGAPKFGDALRLVLRIKVGRDNFSGERRDNLRKTPPDAPETDDPDRPLDQIEGRFALETAEIGVVRLDELIANEGAQVPPPTENQREPMFRDLVGKNPGGGRNRYVGRDHRRRQAPVHPGGGRLNPTEAFAFDDAFPIDRNLRVSAKIVGFEQSVGDVALTDVDDFDLRPSGADASDQPIFDRFRTKTNEKRFFFHRVV